MGVREVTRGARLGLAGLAVVVLLIPAYYNVPGRMTGDALVMSIHRNQPISYVGCIRTGVGENRSCEFVAGGDSDGLEYEVEVTGRCWTARRVEEPPPAEGAYEPYSPQPSRYSGCVVIGDNIRPIGRFMGNDGSHDLRPYPSPQPSE